MDIAPKLLARLKPDLSSLNRRERTQFTASTSNVPTTQPTTSSRGELNASPIASTTGPAWMICASPRISTNTTSDSHRTNSAAMTNHGRWAFAAPAGAVVGANHVHVAIPASAKSNAPIVMVRSVVLASSCCSALTEPRSASYDHKR